MTTHQHAHAARHARTYSELAAHWPRLDREVCFLNHGSFGACPETVLEHQRELRARLEAEPVRFMIEELEPLWLGALERAARFVGCDAAGLAFVPNATTGVNAVLRSVRIGPGDELLTTDHAYNACANALRFVAERAGASVVVAGLPFPVTDPVRVTEAIVERVTPRTRIALVDHVTSPTGMVLPIADIVRRLDAVGVDTLVDGAHAPGMLDLDIASIGAAYYAGNWHKWVCAPKGAGFLFVRADRRDAVRPTVISHGANSDRADLGRFREEFRWTGTADPTAALCVPAAIDAVGALVEGGWAQVRERNRGMALAARATLADRLGLEAVCPASMVGSLAAMVLPAAPGGGDGCAPGVSVGYPTELQRRLVGEWGVQVPIVPWGAHGGRLVRVSSHLYNAPAGHDVLADALGACVSAC